jgi:glycosyltransferase involved in cell wall biosynthesis
VYDFDPEYALNLYLDARGHLQRAAYRWNLAASQRYYRSIYGRFRRVITISSADADQVRQSTPEAQVVVIPLTLDIQDDRPTAAAERLVFVGGGARNLASIYWSLENVLPHLEQFGIERPFEVAGRFTEDEVRDMYRRLHVSGLPADSLSLTRDPRDVRSFLAPGSVLLAPFPWGAGVKVKCVEAVLRGCLVATNSQGARGTVLENGVTGIVSDEGAELADALSKAFHEPEASRALAESGRIAARAAHDPERYHAQWQRAFENSRD